MRPSRMHIVGPLAAWAAYVLALSSGTSGLLTAQEYKDGRIWPDPPVVDPGPAGDARASTAPPDAIVLFDGTDLSAWEGPGVNRWRIEDGVATVRGGNIQTRQHFGDCQLHVEWASPAVVEGRGQGRGNSGVYLMGVYEIQVLDSYNNPTYFDGMAGALYKQKPPLVNVSRKPGEWQTYDIYFKAPRFDDQGQLSKPGYVTVVHNGVLIHNNTEIEGQTAYNRPPQYTAHPDKAPLLLQNHGDAVQFRNIWIREVVDNVPTRPQ